MPLLEDRTVSFIVRIWCERGDADEPTEPEWRGSIEHVPSGQRSFFRDLSAIVEFMKPHLEAIGITAPLRFWERMSAPDVLDMQQEQDQKPEAEPPETAVPPSVARRVRRAR